MLVEHLSCFVFSKIVSKRKSEVVLLYALMMQTHRESLVLKMREQILNLLHTYLNEGNICC